MHIIVSLFDNNRYKPTTAIQYFSFRRRYIDVTQARHSAWLLRQQEGDSHMPLPGTPTPYKNTDTATNLTAGSYGVTTTDSSGCIATGTVAIAQPNPLGISMMHTNDSCSTNNAGTATAIVTGGARYLIPTPGILTPCKLLDTANGPSVRHLVV